MESEKKTYSLEDIEALEAWFGEHEIPSTMQLDKCTFMPDVKKTVNLLLKQAKVFHKNPNLYGGIFLLERIKTKMEGGEEKEVSPQEKEVPAEE